MKKTIETFLKPYLKKNIPDIKPGDTVRVHQVIKEISTKGKTRGEERQRIQVFEGVVLARKHGKGVNSTITVRRVISGVGVEKIFPLHSPTIEKIEIVSRAKVRRAKLYYLRERIGRKAKLKRKEFKSAIIGEEGGEEPKEEANREPGEGEEPAEKEEVKQEAKEGPNSEKETSEKESGQKEK
jgi:large subunit ribosomal protein L19